MFQTAFVEKIKTHVLCSNDIFSENRPVYEKMWNVWYSQTGHRWQ